MYKVVINCCYGGFSLSNEAIDHLVKLGVTLDEWGNLPHNLPRHDKQLIEVVEMLGEKANGFCAKLEIRYVDAKGYKIKDHDGLESIDWLGDDWVVIED